MKYRIGIIALFLTLFLFSRSAANINAGVCDGLSHEDCGKKIDELEQQVTSLSQQAQSLSSQIKFMDTQINLTTARITNTEQVIKITEEEINTLSERIGAINGSLEHLTKILVLKIAQGYKQRRASIFDMLLDPQNAASLVGHVKYLQAAQNSDHFLAVKMERTKQSFEEQKNLREEKKTQLEKLKITLDSQKIALDTQKGQKQTLLTQTNNDERKYRQMLSQALAEYQAVQQALASGTRVGDVKKGDPIGLVGNSGYPHCSTGSHLHLEIRQNNTWVNPMNYLSSHSARDDQNNSDGSFGTGEWGWPLSDPIIITQQYGNTPWSWRYAYSGGVHTGIDMISKSSDVIRAVADGTLFTSSQNCSGSIINIKYIEHGNGVISFYLHVQ